MLLPLNELLLIVASSEPVVPAPAGCMWMPSADPAAKVPPKLLPETTNDEIEVALRYSRLMPALPWLVNWLPEKLNVGDPELTSMPTASSGTATIAELVIAIAPLTVPALVARSPS